MSADGRSLFERAKDAYRSFRIEGKNLRDPELARLFGAEPAAAGIAITDANALNVSAVWASVNVLTGTVISLPLKLYKRLPGGGRELYTGHPLYTLLHDSPNPEQTSAAFLTTVMVNLLLTGNSFAEIERDSAHRPIALWPIAPFRVRPERDAAGRLIYVVRLDSGADVTIEAADMLHFSGLSRDGLVGLSPIACARESLGLAAAAEKFGAAFFGNGSSFGGFLTHPQRLSVEARQNLQESLAKHSGPTHAHRVFLLQEGMTFIERRGIPPEDAQFLATRTFQVQEIARWFGLPPHKIGDLSRSTYSNIENQSIEYVQDAVLPWLRRLEQEINRKVISRLERTQQYAAFSVEGVLRGDSASRSTFYKTMISTGAMTLNEARSLENLNPVAGGDELLIDRNLVPLRIALTASADDAAAGSRGEVGRGEFR